MKLNGIICAGFMPPTEEMVNAYKVLIGKSELNYVGYTRIKIYPKEIVHEAVDWIHPVEFGAPTAVFMKSSIFCDIKS
jgi:hypothetical protein